MGRLLPLIINALHPCIYVRDRMLDLVLVISKLLQFVLSGSIFVKLGKSKINKDNIYLKVLIDKIANKILPIQ
jgi:hypothetical protein